MARSSGTKGLLALLGGILALTSIYLTWVTSTINIFLTVNVSGLGILTILGFNFAIPSVLNGVVLLIVGGVIALVAGILMLANVVDAEKRLWDSIIILAGGILILVGFITWVVGASSANTGNGIVNLFQNVTLGSGFWFALTSSILALLDGIVGIYLGGKFYVRSSSGSRKSAISRKKRVN